MKNKFNLILIHFNFLFNFLELLIIFLSFLISIILLSIKAKFFRIKVITEEIIVEYIIFGSWEEPSRRMERDARHLGLEEKSSSSCYTYIIAFIQ